MSDNPYNKLLSVIDTATGRLGRALVEDEMSFLARLWRATDHGSQSEEFYVERVVDAFAARPEVPDSDLEIHGYVAVGGDKVREV